jgi:TolA-binding protein
MEHWETAIVALLTSIGAGGGFASIMKCMEWWRTIRKDNSELKAAAIKQRQDDQTYQTEQYRKQIDFLQGRFDALAKEYDALKTLFAEAKGKCLLLQTQLDDRDVENHRLRLQKQDLNASENDRETPCGN